MNGIVNRIGHHIVSILMGNGHHGVTMSHSWSNDVTTCACLTNARVNLVWIV